MNIEWFIRIYNEMKTLLSEECNTLEQLIENKVMLLQLTSTSKHPVVSVVLDFDKEEFIEVATIGFDPFNQEFYTKTLLETDKKVNEMRIILNSVEEIVDLIHEKTHFIINSLHEEKIGINESATILNEEIASVEWLEDTEFTRKLSFEVPYRGETKTSLKIGKNNRTNELSILKIVDSVNEGMEKTQTTSFINMDEEEFVYLMDSVHKLDLIGAN